jgi:hypothetical protein
MQAKIIKDDTYKYRVQILENDKIIHTKTFEDVSFEIAYEYLNGIRIGLLLANLPDISKVDMPWAEIAPTDDLF